MNTTDHVRTARGPAAVVLLTAGVILAAGCAGVPLLERLGPSDDRSKSGELDETGYVERLRLKITKVRNAIDETRNAIARSRGAPYLPELYLRLAELKSEEARYHYRLAAEREQTSGGLTNVPQVRLLKNRAVEIYRMMLRRFPDCDLLPRVLFNLGHEQRELGNFQKMRAAFQRLIDNYPESKLRDNALLVMGDHFFDRNKLAEAETYYRQITQGKLGQVSGLAHYKLAWIRINQNECGRALDRFERAIATSRRWEQRPNRGGSPESSSPGSARRTAETRKDIDVRREALVDSTYCYSREREPENAVGYLRKHAYNRATFVEGLAELAQRYRLNDDFRGAVLVTRKLLALAPASSDRIDDVETFYTALKNLEEYRKIGRDVERMASVYERYHSRANLSDDRRSELRETFETYIRDLATRAHERLRRRRGTAGEEGGGALATPAEKASGGAEAPSARSGGESQSAGSASGSAGRTPDRADAASETEATDETSGERESKVAADALGRQIVRGYDVYLDSFPDSEHTTDIRLNAAEALGQLGRYLRAGKQALSAAEAMDRGPPQRNALYDAVVYFQRSIRSSTDRREFERVNARSSLRRAGRRLLSYSIPDDEERRVEFAIAKTYYDEGRYLRAVDKLTALAYEFPGTDEADAAVRLVLDSYDTLNQYDQLRFASNRFLRSDSPASETLQADIRKIRSDARQRKLDQLSLAAAGTEGEGLEPLLQFAREHEGEELGERSLVNAFVAARAMGKTARMYELAQKLEAEYPKSERLPDIFKTVAEVAESRFEYRKAIRFLRRAAKVSPKERAKLLVSVGDLLRRVGRPNEAASVYRRVLEQSDGSGPVGAAAAGLAEILERQVGPKALVRQLETWADTGNAELLARLGVANVALGRRERGQKQLRRVLAAGSQASVGARARAQFGMAEIVYGALREFPEPTSVGGVQKLISLIELAQQKYLSAARLGHAVYTPVTLSRFSRMLTYSAGRLSDLSLPGDLSERQRASISDALSSRIESLKSSAKDALQGCADQAWSNDNFTLAVRRCLKGETLAQPVAEFDTPDRKGTLEPIEGHEKLRERLAKNPKDGDALRRLAKQFYNEGRFHAARIVFSRALSAGGGPDVLVWLGRAQLEVGNLTEAFGAFARAAAGGSSEAVRRLQTVVERAGLSELTDEVNEHFGSGGS
ncbi:MAG: tetratricopeptide repeat protein [Bradymonadaceae bacterium]